MELRHLRYFVAVVEEGNLTTAAERQLRTAQPSLSRQICDGFCCRTPLSRDNCEALRHPREPRSHLLLESHRVRLGHVALPELLPPCGRQTALRAMQLEQSRTKRRHQP